jgi:taurine dioxygenase
MTGVTIESLQDGLPFGARVQGVTRESLRKEAVRRKLVEVFEDRGMIVFEGVEPSSEMQVLISNVIGPLKEHPVKMVERIDGEKLPGVITIRTEPSASVVEIDGKPLMTWQPWHFDHSYNNELNRAGVLRAESIAADGGLTGFADGIQIYNDMNPDARASIETKEILYNLDLRYTEQRFGLPQSFRVIHDKNSELAEIAKQQPHSVHPAVWTRATGEKVLHMSPYGCRGVEGMSEGNAYALLTEVWEEVEHAIKPYYHQWKSTDMIIWDNWRMLHMASGCDPSYDRIVHRTTIKGDYGLGRWQTEPQSNSVSVDAMA